MRKNPELVEDYGLSDAAPPQLVFVRKGKPEGFNADVSKAEDIVEGLVEATAGALHLIYDVQQLQQLRLRRMKIERMLIPLVVVRGGMDVVVQGLDGLADEMRTQAMWAFYQDYGMGDREIEVVTVDTCINV